MPTQQDKIREMANKKLLNGEQKKVLYKLFEAKIEEKLTSIESRQGREFDKFEKKLLNAGKKNQQAKNLVDIIEKSTGAIEEADKKLHKIGLDYRGGYGDSVKCIELSHSNQTLDDFKQKQSQKIDKINTLKLKLLADIHGLPLTYAELTDYVEKEIAKID